MEEAKEYQPGGPGEEIIPVEQATIQFYGKLLLVVRLPDGRPGVVLRSLTDNLQLDRVGQIRRVQRTEAIADDLIANVEVQTEGGPQRVHVLAIRAVAYWLATIDAKRVREEIRADVVRYQWEAVDALYAWAQQPRALPALGGQIVPAELDTTVTTSTAIERPGPGGAILAPAEEPGEEATHSEKATYHEMMSLWHRYQADRHAQAWRAQINGRVEEQEARLESREAVVQLIPEILDRLGPELINLEQQRQVQDLVHQLHEASGKHQGTIYNELKTAFDCPRYQELRADEWPQVKNWFTVQIERAKGK